MKKEIISPLCVVIVLLFFGQAAFAQDAANKFGLGVEISYLQIYDGKWEPNEMAEFNTPPFVGINLSYFFNAYFSSELSIQSVSSDMNINVSGDIRDYGKLQQIPIVLTGRFQIPNKTAVTPYFGAGVAYYINDLNNATVVDASGAPVAVDADNSTGFTINGGVEFPLLKLVGFFIELNYRWNSVDFIHTSVNGATSRIETDLNGPAASMGITYYF